VDLPAHPAEEQERAAGISRPLPLS